MNTKEITMKRQRENHQESRTIYRATVADTINGERVGRFTFGADTIEHARERGWRIAGSRFGNDIHVSIEQISR